MRFVFHYILFIFYKINQSLRKLINLGASLLYGSIYVPGGADYF